MASYLLIRMLIIYPVFTDRCAPGLSTGAFYLVCFYVAAAFKSQVWVSSCWNSWDSYLLALSQQGLRPSVLWFVRAPAASQPRTIWLQGLASLKAFSLPHVTSATRKCGRSFLFLEDRSLFQAWELLSFSL